MDKKKEEKAISDEIAHIKGFNLSQDLNTFWFGDPEEIPGDKVKAREKSTRASHEVPHVINQWT